MKRNLQYTNHLLLVISLLLMVLLTSCKQFAQLNFSPAADQIPTPGSIDSAILLSSYYLVCPTIPSTTPLIPPGPYDEDIGDCALRGKSAEIETWLTALEGIAASCHTSRDTNWAGTLAARSTLDSNIDELEEVNPVTLPSEENPFLSDPLEEQCPVYISTESSDDSSEETSLSSHVYTDWLIRIGEHVGQYCTMIDEIVKPLWQACDKINFYQDCQAPNPEQYHSIILSMMNQAQINYDYTDFFYTHTLQTAGWGNFRSYFNEAYLDCPPVQFGSTTTFTFSMDAFCRIGPSSKYEKMFTFLELQSVEILGRNRDEPRWWLVLIPDSEENCWVSDSTGATAGFLEDLEIVPAPPLVIKPVENKPNAKVCSKDLGQSACVAAGGTWVDGGATGASYCVCK